MMECPVCLETVTTTTLTCGHHICTTCLFELRRPVCPICREPLFRHVEFYNSEDDELLVEMLDDRDPHTLMQELVTQLDHVEEDGNIVVLGYNPTSGTVERVPVHAPRPPRRRRRRRRPRRPLEQLLEPMLRRMCMDALRQYVA